MVIGQVDGGLLHREMLHTLGASDKYNRAIGQPVFPEGYAEPALQPRYPQKTAELMGVYIAISSREAVMPKSLHKTLEGKQTAEEIGRLETE